MLAMCTPTDVCTIDWTKRYVFVIIMMWLVVIVLTSPESCLLDPIAVQYVHFPSAFDASVI